MEQTTETIKPDPAYERNGVILYQCRWQEILPFLDERFPLILTDPPYEEQAHKKGRRVDTKIKYVGAGGPNAARTFTIPFDPITEEERDAFALEAARLASGWVLTFCQFEAAHKWRASYERAGLGYRAPIIWVAPDRVPNFRGDGPAIGFETILCMHIKARSSWNAGGKRGVYTFNRDSYRTGHATQKPIKLIEALISDFTKPDDIVLDPYLGSGTTAHAAMNLGRGAIGVEMTNAYIRMAIKRLDGSGYQPGMPLIV